MAEQLRLRVRSVKEESVMVQVVVVSTEALGDRSYLAHDGDVAVVVDPQRDIDRIEALLDQLDLRCALVVETHVHNDYVSGGLELARRTGATYVVSAAETVAFEHHAATDGEQLSAGSLVVTVVATPGHTDGHLSYVVEDRDGGPVVFTGGSLLFGSVGRTDLVDVSRTEELTRAQYRSAHHLARLLDDDTPLYPTHGFGSFCSSGNPSGGFESTIGIERKRNDALVIEDEDEFVAKLVSGLTAYPSYYVHMAPLNRMGPGPIDLSPPERTDREELSRRLGAGEWVVDLRSYRAFASEHVAGSVGIALGDQFATYLGWLLPWGTPLTLIGESIEQITDAQRQLVRIGIDRPDGAAVGTPSELAGDDGLRSYPTATFADIPEGTDAVVLDVRRSDERATGQFPGSIHVPLDTLLSRIDELPAGTLWVHCVSAYRASIAASLLDRAGRDVVLIDEDIERAKDMLVDAPE